MITWRAAIRTILRAPAHSVATIAIMAVGIAAGALSFAILKPLFSQPTPFRNAEHTVVVWAVDMQLAGRDRQGVSWNDFAEWRQRSTTLDSIEAFENFRTVLTVGGEHQNVKVARTTPQLLQSWSVRPIIGRLFEHTAQGQRSGAVLSHWYWRNVFGEHRSILGTLIVIDGEPYEIVGVLDQSMEVGDFGRVAAWIPALSDPPDALKDRRSLFVTARLRAGVTLEAANAELRSIAGSQAVSRPTTNAGWSVRVRPIREAFTGTESLTLALFGLFAVCSVVAVACANVSNLVAARSLARAPEFATRLAIGANTWDLARQILLEAGMMAVAAWALASAVIQAGISVIQSQWSGPPLQLTFDWHLLTASLFFAAITVIACGLAPALRIARMPAADVLRYGQAHSSKGPQRLGRALLVGQLGISLALLVVLGMFVQAVRAAEDIPFGFRTADVLVAHVAISNTGGSTVQPRDQIQQWLDETRSITGVIGTAATSSLPTLGPVTMRDLIVRSVTGSTRDVRAALVRIEGNYFAVLGIPTRRGHWPDRPDHGSAAVSESFARTHGVDVGDEVTDKGSGRTHRIVAVVGDVRNRDVGRPPLPHLYVAMFDDSVTDMTLLLRCSGRVSDALREFGHRSRQFSAGAVPFEIASLEQLIGERRAEPYLIVLTIATIAGIALLMAIGGAYALFSFDTARQTREVALRVALGATTPSALGPVVRRQVTTVIIGVAVGTALAAAAGVILSSSLYGVNPVSPQLIASVLAVLLIPTTLALLVPLRRAVRMDPAAVLREA